MATASSLKRKLDDVAAADVAKAVVSYQGQLGSFTYLGAVNFFSRCAADSLNLCPARGLKDVVLELNEGRSDYGVVPLESSTHGSITGVYDLLLASGGKVFIVGEIGQLEEHCLCMNSRSTGKESDITKVYCHPHILDCCSEYLDVLDAQRDRQGKLPLQRIPTWDSAAACTLVGSADSSDLSASAIGSKDAAQFHDMKIIKRGVGNDSNAEV
jgi:chorismate mutase/prephenate dehydratase